jgi:hypothetical protein
VEAVVPFCIQCWVELFAIGMRYLVCWIDILVFVWCLGLLLFLFFLHLTHYELPRPSCSVTCYFSHTTLRILAILGCIPQQLQCEKKFWQMTIVVLENRLAFEKLLSEFLFFMLLILHIYGFTNKVAGTSCSASLTMLQMFGRSSIFFDRTFSKCFCHDGQIS